MKFKNSYIKLNDYDIDALSILNSDSVVKVLLRVLESLRDGCDINTEGLSEAENMFLLNLSKTDINTYLKYQADKQKEYRQRKQTAQENN